MEDDELSRSSGGGDGDFEPEEDNGEDNEATLDEEEALDTEDYANELKELEDEGDLSIEELRRRYGLPTDEDAVETAGTSQSGDDDDGEAGGNVDYFDNSLDEADEADDRDYTPPDKWKKEVRVDEELYQAAIPTLDPNSTVEESSSAIWSPADSIENATLDSYLADVVRMRNDIGQKRDSREAVNHDDEDALCALYRHNYDFSAAKSSFPFSRVNQPFRTVREDALDWDDKEKATFESAMNNHGKNFHVIHSSELPYRRVGELIEYYYKWKKTDRYRNYRKRQLQPDLDYHAFTNSLMHPQHQPYHELQQAAKREAEELEHHLDKKASGVDPAV